MQRIGASNATSSVQCVQFYIHLNNSILSLEKPRDASSKLVTGQHKLTINPRSTYRQRQIPFLLNDTNCAT